MTERRTGPWLILPACVLLAMGAYAWGRRSADPGGDPSAVSSREAGERLAVLEREVRELRAATRRLAALERKDRGLQAPAFEPGSTKPLDSREAWPSDPAAGDEHDDLDPAEADHLADQAQTAFWDELAKRIDSEPIDTAWRRETESAITRVISEQIGPEVRVDRVFCASSLCRATLSHPGWPRIPNDKLVKFAMNRESLGTMEMQLDAREQGATTLYFLRNEAAPDQQ